MQDKLLNITGAPGLTDVIITPLFSNAGVIFLLVTPLLTMRVICDERRNKTLCLLFSAPVTNSDIILGKYLGTLGLMWVIVILVGLMPFTLLLGGDIDTGKFFANGMALILLVAAFASTGILMSTLAEHPTVAAISTFGILIVLWLLNINQTMSDKPNELIQGLSLLYHYQNIQTGLIDSRDIIYFLLYICTFIVLSIYCLANQRLQK